MKQQHQAKGQGWKALRSSSTRNRPQSKHPLNFCIPSSQPHFKLNPFPTQFCFNTTGQNSLCLFGNDVWKETFSPLLLLTTSKLFFHIARIHDSQTESYCDVPPFTFWTAYTVPSWKFWRTSFSQAFRRVSQQTSNDHVDTLIPLLEHRRSSRSWCWAPSLRPGLLWRRTWKWRRPADTWTPTPPVWKKGCWISFNHKRLRTTEPVLKRKQRTKETFITLCKGHSPRWVQPLLHRLHHLLQLGRRILWWG